ncbi:hypothetical protein [Yinghuangia seranimata]|uniref:hypothetical protein n=1 Tax=Yinghuangia seranimata TaxID=408067 RepID=UPI00248B4CDD|nr:hypothetical protein [Yinghuangia seranimata]MDI2129749.1 hypothetical protein [Yinghuangia seranimata]
MPSRSAPRFSCLSIVVASVLVIGLVVGGLVVMLKLEARRDLKRTDKLALEHARHWATVVAGEMDAGASPMSDALQVDFFQVKVKVVTLERSAVGVTGIVKAEEKRTTTFGHSVVHRCFSYDIPVKPRGQDRFAVLRVTCPPVLPGIGGG